MSPYLKYLVHSLNWSAELGVWEVGRIFFLFQRKLCIPFWYIMESYKIGLCTTVWIRGFGSQLPLSKRASVCSRYGFFGKPSLILSHLDLSKIELPKLTSNILMQIFIILFVLDPLWQVVSLKKIVTSSPIFTILISWSPTCIPLILLLALMKLASTSSPNNV